MQHRSSVTQYILQYLGFGRFEIDWEKVLWNSCECGIPYSSLNDLEGRVFRAVLMH